MKRFHRKTLFVVLVALGAAANLMSDPPGKTPVRAIVRSVKGTATCGLDGAFNPLKSNKELPPGASITTGPRAHADLSVNGSFLRLQAESAMSLQAMNSDAPAEPGDTETMIDLKAGCLVGHLQKLTANSRYEIKTPHGVVGLRTRGTDFAVSVAAENGGKYLATFTCLQGDSMVSVVVDGAVQTKPLHSGESWTPGTDDVHPTPDKMLAEFRKQINAALPLISLP